MVSSRTKRMRVVSTSLLLSLGLLIVFANISRHGFTLFRGTDKTQLAPATSAGVALPLTGAPVNAQTTTPAAPVSDGSPPMRVSMDDMEAVGPFVTWLNVKHLGAIGDGVADDTRAIQDALSDLGKPGRAAVLYFPAGTYRITKTLNVVGNDTWGLTLIGEDPATTSILWGGPAGANMLVINGGFNSRLSRLTWNGAKKAGIGVAHWWNTAQVNMFGGSAQHVDEVFVDMGIGIMGGRLGNQYGQLDSEGEIRRVKFIRNTRAGFDVGSWNALDWWVFDSEFIDCARGVSNEFSAEGQRGAGNFMIYRSLFQRSTVADVTIGNTSWFSMHNNVSVGSRRFFQSAQIGANPAAIIMQNNRILDTTDPVSIYNGNVGPLTLIDNEIRSRAGIRSGPAVELDDPAPGQDAISVGNKFTVANPIAMRAKVDRMLSIGDQRVGASQISSVLPVLPGTAKNLGRTVHEVGVGASADTIQAAIDNAAASGADGAIVHLAPGNYNLTKTLTIPAGKKVQLMGDSLATMIYWQGPAGGPVIDLPGPSLATVRDLRIIARDATAIRIGKADQPGGRIFQIGNVMGAVTVADLAQTRIEWQANTTIATLGVTASKSVLATGSGGIGPINLLSGSNVHLTDTWYEGDLTNLFRGDSGNFTYLGGNMAPADRVHGGGNAEPAILLNNFNGRASFIGLSLSLQTASNGIYIGAETANTNALFLGISANEPDYFRRTSRGGSVGLVSSKLFTRVLGAVTIPDQGETSAGFIQNQLAQTRAVVWDSAPYVVPAGATDVRIYRTHTVDTKAGLQVSGQ
jgi:hypothetical protein